MYVMMTKIFFMRGWLYILLIFIKNMKNQININIGKALHKALKKKAIDEEISMSKAVNRAIEEYVNARKEGEK